MRYLFLYLVIGLTIFIESSLAQESQTDITKVEYGVTSRYTSIIDTTKIKDNEINSYLASIIEASDPTAVTYTLLFNKNESIFSSNYSMKSNKKIIDPNLYIINAKNIGDVYSNLPTNEVLRATQSYGKFFLIDYGTLKNEWQITTESKKITTLTCYKATKNIKTLDANDNIIDVSIESWFSPKINSSFGPLWFNGLPGLILELHFENFIYYAKKIEKITQKPSQIKRPTKGMNIKYLYYLEWLKNVDTSDKQMMLEKN